MAADPPGTAPEVAAWQGTDVANKVFRTLWDGDGTDLIDLSNYATDLATDLRPGHGIDLDVGGTALRAVAVSTAGGDSLITFSGVAASASLSLVFATDGPSGTGGRDDADGSDDLTPGATLVYTYTLDNTGAVALTDVPLSDSAATGLDAAGRCRG